LHIAFAGGGISRVIYDPNLKEERSKSFSSSINYDKATENWVAGFTLEALHQTICFREYWARRKKMDLTQSFRELLLNCERISTETSARKWLHDPK
jgi:hypothetical protein